MALPENLVECYHAITCGQALLSTDGHDFFPQGQEPEFRRSHAVDTPDCAGRVEGELFHRGNVRWTMRITRVREFLSYSYPHDISGGPTVNNAQEHAQVWLARHLTALPDDTVGLVWTDVRSWPQAVLEAEGTTDGGFAVVSYSLQMTDASA